MAGEGTAWGGASAPTHPGRDGRGAWATVSGTLPLSRLRGPWPGPFSAGTWPAGTGHAHKLVLYRITELQSWEGPRGRSGLTPAQLH